MKPAEEEEDVLDALGTLASFARCALGSCPTQGRSMLRISIWTSAYTPAMCQQKTDSIRPWTQQANMLAEHCHCFHAVARPLIQLLSLTKCATTLLIASAFTVAHARHAASNRTLRKRIKTWRLEMMMMMMTSHSHASHLRVPCRSKNVMRCRNGCSAPSVPNGARSAPPYLKLQAVWQLYSHCPHLPCFAPSFRQGVISFTGWPLGRFCKEHCTNIQPASHVAAL